MSDVPEGYYLGPNGEILLDFRRIPNLDFRQVVSSPNARKRSKTGSGRKRRNILLERDGFLCHYCRCLMVLPVPGYAMGRKTATIEHIVPRSIGGTSSLYNLVLACNKCNNEYGDALNKCFCDQCVEAFKKFNEKTNREEE